MRRLREHLETLLIALNQARIEVLLLKGSALAATVYGSFRDRLMSDIDLLVRPEQAEDVRKVMLRLDWEIDGDVPEDHSYYNHQHLPPLRDRSGSGLRLEIHRSVLPARHPFRFTDDELWRAARPVSVGAACALVMQPEYHAVHIAIHFAWLHMMRRGAWNAFRDLNALDAAASLDWARVASLATRMGAASCCYWTLQLGHALAALSVPMDVWRGHRPRMPKLMRRSLVRHFINEVAQTTRCPSVRLRQALWRLAVQPHSHGHGAVRPWSVTVELLSAIREMVGPAREPSTELSFRKMRQCASYLSELAT